MHEGVGLAPAMTAGVAQDGISSRPTRHCSVPVSTSNAAT
jgi:hypothetical protein